MRESAKLNGHDAWAYLKDVLSKLATWPNSKLEELAVRLRKTCRLMAEMASSEVLKNPQKSAQTRGSRPKKPTD